MESMKPVRYGAPAAAAFISSRIAAVQSVSPSALAAAGDAYPVRVNLVAGEQEVNPAPGVHVEAAIGIDVAVNHSVGEQSRGIRG